MPEEEWFTFSSLDVVGEAIPRTLNVNLVLPNLAEFPAVKGHLAVSTEQFRATCVSMGNPHCIIFVDKITDAHVLMAGPQIEQHPAFPRRVNVEFVEVHRPDDVSMRVWERGSGETLACGTGACAVAVAGAVTGRTQRRVTIHLRGGDLQLHWSETDNHVYMTGPAVEVFIGEWP